MTELREKVARAIADVREGGWPADTYAMLQQHYLTMADAALAVIGPASVSVKPGQLERIVWPAMAWARENPSPDEVPEYTDGGNSFAETECRAAVRRILAALEPASVQDAARLRALASGLQGLATDLRGGEDEADELLGEVIATLRALAEGKV